MSIQNNMYTKMTSNKCIEKTKMSIKLSIRIPERFFEKYRTISLKKSLEKIST